MYNVYEKWHLDERWGRVGHTNGQSDMVTLYSPGWQAQTLMMQK